MTVIQIFRSRGNPRESESKAVGMIADFIQMDHKYARYFVWRRRRRIGNTEFVELARNACFASGYTLSIAAAHYILSNSQPLAGVADWPCDMMPLRPLAAMPHLTAQPHDRCADSSLEDGRAPLLAQLSYEAPADGPVHDGKNRKKRFLQTSYWKYWWRKRTSHDYWRRWWIKQTMREIP